MQTSGYKYIEEHGRHRKVRFQSYLIALTEIGGEKVKSVRLDEQTSITEAVRTVLKDNPGWRFKGYFTLTERDFEGEDKQNVSQEK